MAITHFEMRVRLGVITITNRCVARGRGESEREGGREINEDVSNVITYPLS